MVKTGSTQLNLVFFITDTLHLILKENLNLNEQGLSAVNPPALIAPSTAPQRYND